VKDETVVPHHLSPRHLSTHCYYIRAHHSLITNLSLHFQAIHFKHALAADMKGETKSLKEEVLGLKEGATRWLQGAKF
jgi:hypothetical protein